MGNLVYGDAQFDIEFDNSLLAHLQIVIGAKLRRNEPFYLSWTAESATGPRKNSIWLEHSIPLRYHYSDDSTQPIDRVLLERLAAAANTSNGLVATQQAMETAEEQLV